MAIKKALEILEVYSGTKYNVKVGESWLIKNIYLKANIETQDLFHLIGVDNQYIHESYEPANVGYFSELKFGNPRKNTLWGYLYEKGIWRGIPLAEGQVFYLSSNNWLNYRAYLILEKHDAGDIKSTDPNGTQATERDVVLKLRTIASTLSAGDNYMQQDMSYVNIFMQEGNELKVPPATEITIFGFLVADVIKISSSGANKQYTNYLKVIKDRENLFSDIDKGFPLTPDLNKTADGTYIGSGNSITGMYTTKDPREILWLPEPVLLTEGEKIAIAINTTVASGSANIAYSDIPVWAICRVRKIR